MSHPCPHCLLLRWMTCSGRIGTPSLSRRGWIRDATSRHDVAAVVLLVSLCALLSLSLPVPLLLPLGALPVPLSLPLPLGGGRDGALPPCVGRPRAALRDRPRERGGVLGASGSDATTLPRGWLGGRELGTGFGRAFAFARGMPVGGGVGGSGGGW